MTAEEKFAALLNLDEGNLVGGFGAGRELVGVHGHAADGLGGDDDAGGEAGVIDGLGDGEGKMGRSLTGSPGIEDLGGGGGRRRRGGESEGGRGRVRVERGEEIE